MVNDAISFASTALQIQSSKSTRTSTNINSQNITNTKSHHKKPPHENNKNSHNNNGNIVQNNHTNNNAECEVVNTALKRARLHFLRVLDVERNRVESEWRLRLKQQDKQLRGALGVITSSVDQLRGQVLFLQRMLRKMENENVALEEELSAHRNGLNNHTRIDVSLFATPTPQPPVLLHGQTSAATPLFSSENEKYNENENRLNEHESERLSFSSDSSFLLPRPPSLPKNNPSSSSNLLRSKSSREDVVGTTPRLRHLPNATNQIPPQNNVSRKSIDNIPNPRIFMNNIKKEKELAASTKTKAKDKERQLHQAHQKIARQQRLLKRALVAMKLNHQIFSALACAECGRVCHVARLLHETNQTVCDSCATARSCNQTNIDDLSTSVKNVSFFQFFIVSTN